MFLKKHLYNYYNYIYNYRDSSRYGNAARLAAMNATKGLVGLG